MSIEIVISSAVVAAIITVFGNIIAAKINQKTTVKTAAETANNELAKMRATWSREDLVSSDEEFADMANSVARYINTGSYNRHTEAMGKIASVRSKETGNIGATLDTLYSCVKAGRIKEADEALTAAIAQKRNLKRQNPEAPKN